VGLNIGVGVSVGVRVGVIVSVGVIVGPAGPGMAVLVAEAVGVGVSDGVKVRVTVWVGIDEGLAVALSFAAATVGKAVRVGVELGVGLEAVGEMPASTSGVRVEQPATVLTTMTRSRNAASAGIPAFRLLATHRRDCFF
jgi:hypothetical protein